MQDLKARSLAARTKKAAMKLCSEQPIMTEPAENIHDQISGEERNP